MAVNSSPSYSGTLPIPEVWDNGKGDKIVWLQWVFSAIATTEWKCHHQLNDYNLFPKKAHIVLLGINYAANNDASVGEGVIAHWPRRTTIFTSNYRQSTYYKRLYSADWAIVDDSYGGDSFMDNTSTIGKPIYLGQLTDPDSDTNSVIDYYMKIINGDLHRFTVKYMVHTDVKNLKPYTHYFWP